MGGYGARPIGTRTFADATGDAGVAPAGIAEGAIDGTSSLIFTATGTLSLRRGLTGTAAMVFGATATAVRWDLITGTASAKFSAFANLSAPPAPVPPPGGEPGTPGSTLTWVKRVSPTMPTPVLSDLGRPT